MNDVDPQAYLADVLAKIANRHPVSKLDELSFLGLTSAGQRPWNKPLRRYPTSEGSDRRSFNPADTHPTPHDFACSRGFCLDGEPFHGGLIPRDTCAWPVWNVNRAVADLEWFARNGLPQSTHSSQSAVSVARIRWAENSG